jgi:hypothetical protein
LIMTANGHIPTSITGQPASVSQALSKRSGLYGLVRVPVGPDVRSKKNLTAKMRLHEQLKALQPGWACFDARLRVAK